MPLSPSRRIGNWPHLELLDEHGRLTALGETARELALLPRSAGVIPVNHDYENAPLPAYLRPDWSAAEGIVDAKGDHPKFHLVQGGDLESRTMHGRLIRAGAGRVIRKIAFHYRTNYDPSRVQLVLDLIDQEGQYATRWQGDDFGPQQGDVEITVARDELVESLGIGLITTTPFTYTYPTAEWFGEMTNVILYTEPVNEPSPRP